MPALSSDLYGCLPGQAQEAEKASDGDAVIALLKGCFVMLLIGTAVKLLFIWIEWLAE